MSEKISSETKTPIQLLLQTLLNLLETKTESHIKDSLILALKPINCSISIEKLTNELYNSSELQKKVKKKL